MNSVLPTFRNTVDFFFFFRDSRGDMCDTNEFTMENACFFGRLIANVGVGWSKIYDGNIGFRSKKLMDLLVGKKRRGVNEFGLLSSRQTFEDDTDVIRVDEVLK